MIIYQGDQPPPSPRVVPDVNGYAVFGDTDAMDCNKGGKGGKDGKGGGSNILTCELIEDLLNKRDGDLFNPLLMRSMPMPLTKRGYNTGNKGKKPVLRPGSTQGTGGEGTGGDSQGSQESGRDVYNQDVQNYPNAGDYPGESLNTETGKLPPNHPKSSQLK